MRKIKLILFSGIDWHLLVGSLITLLIIMFFSYSAVNFDFLDPIELAISDIDFSDLRYVIFREDESVQVDTNIVLVNISSMSRGTLAEMLTKISEQNPKVVGIDAVFESFNCNSEDSALAKSLAGIKNLVMVTKLTDFNQESEVFTNCIYSSKEFTFNAKEGFANIPENNSYRTIRNTHFKLPHDNIFKESFAVVLIKEINEDSYRELIKRDNEYEIINYHGNLNKFYYLDYDDLFNKRIDLSFLNNKIVLMGYMGESYFDMEKSLEDKFYTPLNNNYVGRSYPDMFGIVIHANIVSMILKENYISEIPLLIKLLIVLLVLYFNARILKAIYYRFPDFYGISSKILIVIESPVLLFINLLIILSFSIKIDLKFLYIGIIFLPDILESYFKKLSKKRKI